MNCTKSYQLGIISTLSIRFGETIRRSIGVIQFPEQAVSVRTLACLVLWLACSGCQKSTIDDSSAKVVSGEPDSTQVSNEARNQQTTESLKQESSRLESSLFKLWQELSFTYRNGQEQDQFSILESLGGGVGMLDYDQDGNLDLCFPGGGTFTESESLQPASTCLQRNTGSKNEQSPFVDQSVASGIAEARFYSHGVAVADYDNDGFSDLLITGYGGLMLWHNMGDGTFQECSAIAGLDSHLWSSSAAWGDFNSDGFVDLYVVNYVDWSFNNNPICKSHNGLRDVCPPRDFTALKDLVYFSDANGKFQEVGQTLGLKSDGKGLGVVLADFDQDGWLDAYIANDTTNNFLYLNRQGQTFEESAELRGVAYDDRGIPNGSMGVDVLDYNLDGQLDIWVANYEDETFALYRNVGSSYFMHVSKSAGLTSFGQSYVGFGSASGDFDLDGDEDLLIANGHVIRHPQRSARRQKPLLLINSMNRFSKVEFPQSSYMGQVHEGRGLAIGDLNKDGMLDAAISHLNANACVLKNNHRTDNWLKVRLIGSRSNRDAIGAVVTLVTNRRQIVRVVKGGGSYLSSSDKTLHWGLAESESAERIEVNWPSGRKQQLELPSLPQELLVCEPDEGDDD